MNYPIVYAAKHKNDAIRALARSGGFFTAASDLVLASGGVVYGCIMTEDNKAVHVRADNKELRDKMCGSKYVQSTLGNTFQSIAQDLHNGLKVLFSGTSCQVAGLKKFLGRPYDSLICIDIVCHGVPSPLILQQYLNWQEKRNHSKVININFRNKKDFGWGDHIETLTFENGKTLDTGVYRSLFYGHCTLRPSCFECPFKKLEHPGDITIADYWGIDQAAPGFNDNKGVSLVLVNDPLGEDLFSQVADELEWRQTRIEDSMQPPFKGPFPKPEKREAFWNDCKTGTFDDLVSRYAKETVVDKAKIILKKMRRRVLGL